jgi:hypothetical protein
MYANIKMDGNIKKDKRRYALKWFKTKQQAIDYKTEYENI